MSTQKEETRARLFSAARKLLVKRGFHHVGLEDIAEAAGVSRQAVYKSHFASKAELLLALVRHLHVVEDLDELVKPFAAARSGVEKLHEAIRTTVRIQSRIQDIALVLAAAASSDPGAAAALQDRLELKRGALRAALQLIEQEGGFNPEWQLEEAVELLAALLSVDSYQRLVHEQGWQPERLIQRVFELAQVFLRIPEPRKSRRKRAAR